MKCLYYWPDKCAVIITALLINYLFPAGQKNFRCTVCGKSFTQKAHVESHMVIHTGAKNIKCDHCDKMFVRKQDLKQHMYSHSL